MDSMRVTELESIPGLGIFTDFKKKHSKRRLDWNFLFRALEVFSLGPCIHKWIRVRLGLGYKVGVRV